MRLVVSASLLVFVCASAVGAQVKWVPLNQVQRGPAKRPVAAAHIPVPSPTPVAQPTEAPVAPPTNAPPVAPQVAPMVPAVTSAGGTQQPLQITCFGGGTANKATAATAWSNGQVSGTTFGSWGGMSTWSGSGSGTTTVYGTRQQAFGDQVDVRLFNGDDRIRMPRTMLPLIRGGKEGWFKLKNVVADARSIRATAAVNFMNNPRVYIDRVTGTITISGKAGDFSGQCQAMQADAPARF